TLAAASREKGGEELLAALAGFDYLGSIESRVLAIDSIRAALPSRRDPMLEALGEDKEALISGRVGLEIWIGE
ncbi:MAG: hypothetical protein KC457_21155, partial [Myxococcales bacterium]|nr:hypothetical protein [Myxococcales bacterium]